jgi:hypothetical protein
MVGGAALKVEAELYRRGAENGFGVIQAAGSWHQPLLPWLVGRPYLRRLPLGSPHKTPRYFLLGGIPRLGQTTRVLNRSRSSPLLGPVGGYYLNTFVTLPGYPYHARRGRNLLIGKLSAACAPFWP